VPSQTVVYVLVAVLAAWLLVLSLLFASVVRHLGAMEATLVTVSKGERFDFSTDGPALMSEVPRGIARVLGEQGVDAGGAYAVLFVSAGCAPCLERAREFAASGAAPDARLVTLISGHYDEGAEELRQVLGAMSAAVVRDPDAREIAKLANINSTPFAFRVTNGKITDKSYIGSSGDLRRMVAAVPVGSSPS